MQRLNLQFRQQDKPTDVLSFPTAERHGWRHRDLHPGRASPGGRQRPCLLTEVKVLILHGMLHLAGHDHESDRGQMSALSEASSELKLPAGSH